MQEAALFFCGVAAIISEPCHCCSLFLKIVVEQSMYGVLTKNADVLLFSAMVAWSFSFSM